MAMTVLGNTGPFTAANPFRLLDAASPDHLLVRFAPLDVACAEVANVSGGDAFVARRPFPVAVVPGWLP